MNNLGPWNQVADDVALRLTRATSTAAQQYVDWQREFSDRLSRTSRGLLEGDRAGSASFEERSLSRLGARGAIPPSGRFGPYTPSALELHVRSRRLSIDDELSNMLRPSANGVFITRDPDGVLYIYKPFHQEYYGDQNWLPHVDGQLAIREVAGYRVFELIDAPRVPPTALVDGPRGPGMAQLYVPLKRSKPESNYLETHRAQTAMGHFLVGNADGNEGNHRPRHNGNPAHHPDDDLVAYDLGYSFPESRDPLRGTGEEGEEDGTEFSFLSPFIRAWDGATFPQHVLDPVDALTPDRMGSALEDLKLGDSAIDGALERLAYVHRNHTIHGDSFTASQ
ncbi:hypothetical protein [Nocardia sp. NPDC051463]|uniref:hypothetical protein n=1 Tax=Nocardia sp. NPDC051463 TaxID=3154845 RepID=UPI00344E1CAE